MSNNLIEDRAFVNSIVGEGTRFKGELDLNGLLRIDGDFTGTIKTTGKVLVGKNGRAECIINASTVVIGGVVKGNIYSSDRVIVLSSGMILGNIYTPRLIVEEGVLLDGECVIAENYNKNKDGKGSVGTELPEKADSASDKSESTGNEASESLEKTESTGSAEYNKSDSKDSSESSENKQSAGNHNR